MEKKQQREDAVEWGIQELAFAQGSTANTRKLLQIVNFPDNPYRNGRHFTLAQVEAYLAACRAGNVERREDYRHNQSSI